MFQTVPLSIIRGFSLYTHEWHMSCSSLPPRTMCFFVYLYQLISIIESLLASLYKYYCGLRGNQILQFDLQVTVHREKFL